MRKIGADKIYTDSWLSISFLEKLNVTFFLNQIAAIFFLAAGNERDCNYFKFYSPRGSPASASNRKKKLSQSEIFK